MLTGTTGIVKLILSLLLFPMFFQDVFISFAWGSGEELWLMLAKRIFLLLPALVIIMACWLSIASMVTVIIRNNRREFIATLLITWWDLGKAIISFWGGVFKFLFNLSAALVNLFKIFILAIWSLIQEILFMPFRIFGRLGRSITQSSVPWIAVFLTLFWCLIEAVIFTYVTTPLIVDTFSNITGEQFSENIIRIPLFIFLLFVVLGSYAVLSTFVDSFKQKSIGTILGIGVIEIVVLFVEVVFLYREFVDSLVPWFAQYSENFELGIFWTLAISCFAWFGIRSLSWFLFAAHGTPTIMAVIQGKGLKITNGTKLTQGRITDLSMDFMQKIKTDTVWIQNKGEELLASFMLPPLQVVAAGINFFTVLITAKPLFELPFKNIDDIMDSKILINNISRKRESFNEA